MSFEVRSDPPATVYSISSSNLPGGLSFNVSELNHFGDTRFQWELLFVGPHPRQGFGIDNLEPHFLECLQSPVVGVGSLLEVGGRTARLQGELIDSGGTANQITLYYGDADANDDFRLELQRGHRLLWKRTGSP